MIKVLSTDLIFTFELNDMTYAVYIVDEINNADSTLGETNYETQVIRIKRGKPELMLRTLKHELVHVWLNEFGHYQHERNFSSEDVCEIVSCSNDFINEQSAIWCSKLKEWNNIF